MRPVKVLANPGSGIGGAERKRDIESAFDALGVRADVQLRRGPEMAAAARQAVADGESKVVVAGGDGSVGAVSGALCDTRVPLGILPMGTLNHFARDAGLPLDLAEAARVTIEGRPESVDVAEVNGHVFVNNSSIGIYPRTLHHRRQQGDGRGLGRHLATARAAWSVLRRLPAHHVLLSLDGKPILRTTSFVFVGNNLYSTELGSLGSRPSLSEGHLGVYHARRPGRATVLNLAARALVGRLHTARDLQVDQAGRLTIQSRRPLLRVALDGEVMRLAPPLEYRIRPRSLLLMRPAEAP